MLRLFKRFTLILVSLVILSMVATAGLYATGKLPYKAYLVHTGSMGQTIPPGSVVLVRDHQYRVGQVITFKVGAAIVTHRLIAIKTNGDITTKGDANPTVDPWTANKADIIGGVVRTSPLLGYVYVYLFMGWRGPASILLLAFTIIMAWLLFKELNKAPPKPIIAQSSQ